MKKNNIELLQCPFCGGQPRFKKETICCGHGDYRDVNYIECEKCGASSPRIWMANEDKAIADIVEKWNARTPDNWIPFSEQPPKEGQKILATIRYGEFEAVHINQFINIPYYEELIKNGELIAWQPLPKPYKGGENE